MTFPFVAVVARSCAFQFFVSFISTLRLLSGVLLSILPFPSTEATLKPLLRSMVATASARYLESFRFWLSMPIEQV